MEKSKLEESINELKEIEKLKSDKSGLLSSIKHKN